MSTIVADSPCQSDCITGFAGDGEIDWRRRRLGRCQRSERNIGDLCWCGPIISVPSAELTEGVVAPAPKGAISFGGTRMGVVGASTGCVPSVA